jgi:hypothetical protein
VDTPEQPPMRLVTADPDTADHRNARSRDDQAGTERVADVGRAVWAWLQPHLRRLKPALSWLRDHWLAGVTAVAACLMLVLLLKVLVAIIGAAGEGLHRLAGWFTDGPITHSINDPVRAWLDAHATGLPATGRDLWLVWLVTAGVLYLYAVFGSRYARIGWAAIGVLTAAAAYAGAGPAGSGGRRRHRRLLAAAVPARLLPGHVRRRQRARGTRPRPRPAAYRPAAGRAAPGGGGPAPRQRRGAGREPLAAGGLTSMDTVTCTHPEVCGISRRGEWSHDAWRGPN